MASAFQIIYAPHRVAATGKKSVFLSGNANKSAAVDWRIALSESLSPLPITIYNPFRSDWTSDWKENLSDPRFKEQVEWELDMMEKSDVIVICLHHGTDAPISLLELGLCARSGKAIIMAEEGTKGFSKLGNVQAVAKTFGLTLVHSIDELRAAIVSRLAAEGVEEKA